MTVPSTRPAAHYIHGGGEVIVVPARVCAFLNRYAGLAQFRETYRGGDPQVDEVLTAFRVAELTWQRSATGTEQAAKPELDATLEWLSTTQVAERLRLTDRAIRKAITEGRLHADNIAGRWRISRESFEHYKAARAAQTRN